MATTTAIPIQLDQTAAARVSFLHLQEQLDLMLDRIQELVPDVIRLKVVLQPKYDQDDDPTVVIEAHRPIPSALSERMERPDRAWVKWYLSEFGPDVTRHFVLTSVYEDSHAG